MDIYIQGFLLGLSLIVAIGSQNAFVLRQGLLNQHVLPVVLCCAISDALLIMLGVSGFYLVIKTYPVIVDLARFLGAAFLIVYALIRFKSAYQGKSQIDLTVEGNKPSLAMALVSCLAFTFLNPHVYLDTVFLLGSLASVHGDNAWLFALGASTASIGFFFSLGFGARFLRPLFTKAISWQILDVLIGVTLLLIAFNLLFFFSL